MSRLRIHEWAHVEAKAHGIRIDEKKLADWTDWSRKKSLAKRVFFKLDDKAVDASPSRSGLASRSSSATDSPRDRVRRGSLPRQALTPEELKEQQKTLVKEATMKRTAANDGGSLETMAQLLLGRDRSAKDADAGFQVGTAEMIVGMQEAQRPLEGGRTAAGPPLVADHGRVDVDALDHPGADEPRHAVAELEAIRRESRRGRRERDR